MATAIMVHAAAHTQQRAIPAEAIELLLDFGTKHALPRCSTASICVASRDTGTPMPSLPTMGCVLIAARRT